MEKLQLTEKEVTNLILAAAMFKDISAIEDKGVKATVLKVQAASSYDNGSVTTPPWEVIARRQGWF